MIVPRVVSHILAACLLFAPVGHAGDEPIVPRKSPTPLFNGRELSGLTTWLADTRQADPRGVFRVRDSMLHISGDGFGYLSTDRAYRDYRLVVEFRWGKSTWRGREKAARDSGIFLHTVGPDGNSFDGNGAFKAGIECQVMQGSVGDLLLIKGRDADGTRILPKITSNVAPRDDADGWPFWRAGGRERSLSGTGRLNWFGKDAGWKDVLGFRGANDVEGRETEWTRLECECAGDSIRVFVNGQLVNHAREVHPAAGRILLQCEAAEILFRRFELHPLP